MKRLAFILGVLMGCVLCFAACGGSSDEPPEEEPVYTVTVTATGGGQATADKQSAKAGETVTVQTTCPETHRLVSLTYNGTPFESSFRMPAQDVDVVAKFAEQTADLYDVLTDASNGGVLLADPIRAKAGETVRLTAIPEAGFVLGTVTLNGAALESMQFEMPAGDALVYATFARDRTQYRVTAQNGRYGKVTVDKTSAMSGEIVTADWLPFDGHVLDHFTVNGEDAGKNREIVMPSGDAVISAVFIKAIGDTPVHLSIAGNNNSSQYYWYFRYTETGLTVTVKAIDSSVVITEEPHYRDYVECIVGLYDPFAVDWTVGKTIKLTVTADGTLFLRRAVRTTAFGKEIFDVGPNFRATVRRKSIAHKDGYSGYEVTMEIDYALLGVTAEEGYGNITICPAMNNSESALTGSWRNLCVWFDVSTHLHILEDGLPA